MDWMIWLEFLKDENIAKFMSDYTIAIGIIAAAIGIIVKRSPGETDDAIWEAIKNKFRLVKK